MADSGRPELSVAQTYAEHLLAGLEIRPQRPLRAPSEHPAASWARSGLMWLTGQADGAALMCAAPLAACADGALAALASLAPGGAFDGLRGSQLLAERAAITGARRQGTISAGGSCRLLEAADGWIAVNLARLEDWELLPAWLESDVLSDWDAVSVAVRERSAVALAQRARWLGLAVAASRLPIEPTGWFATSPRRKPGSSALKTLDAGFRRHDEPLVIDLSSLWAGPLCGQLLRACGARVIKVESAQRPDGARRGPPGSFDLLNEGKASVALDFTQAAGRAQLRRLVARADIVIESTRPRALRQLGIDADELLSKNPRLTWVGITAYGRGAPEQDWIGYGDDIGVAAGLSELMHRASGQRVFAGDAIADPLTGLHAALAAWTHSQSGGGRLISVAMTDVVKHCIHFDSPADAAARQRDWTARATDIRPPRGRAAREVARPLGADTERILAELGG